MSRWSKFKHFKPMLAFFLMLLGSICLVWGVWPLPQKGQTILLAGPTTEMMNEAQSQAVARIQSWRITAQTPLFLRIGESTKVSLTIEALPDPLQAALEPQYQLEAEVRCDLAGMQHTPLGNIHSALLPGHRLHFTWQVAASQPGSAAGVLWFYLDFIPLSGSQVDALPPLPLSAQEFTIRSVSLAGLGVSQARLLGLIVLFSGIALLVVRL